MRVGEVEPPRDHAGLAQLLVDLDAAGEVVEPERVAGVDLGEADGAERVRLDVAQPEAGRQVDDLLGDHACLVVLVGDDEVHHAAAQHHGARA